MEVLEFSKFDFHVCRWYRYPYLLCFDCLWLDNPSTMGGSFITFGVICPDATDQEVTQRLTSYDHLWWMVKSSLCNLLLDGFDHHFSHLIEKHSKRPETGHF